MSRCEENVYENAIEQRIRELNHAILEDLDRKQ